MIRRFLSKRIFGYSVRRWFPTIVALSIILTHAIASPFWYRTAAGTRIVHTAVVSPSDMRFATGLASLNSYEDRSSDHIFARRAIQRAIDAEQEGTSRTEARGAITLPVPTVFLDLPELQSDDGQQFGHQFRCDYKREDCSLMLQSSAYYVHILQGPNFVARLLVDRPLLAIRTKDEGVHLTGIRFPRPEIWIDGIPAVTERFTPSKSYLAITGGSILDQYAFNNTDLNLSSFYDGTFVSLPPFVAFDMDYTLDFRDPGTNHLMRCAITGGEDQNLPESEAAHQDPCKFAADDLSLFALSQCDASEDQCPSRTTDPVFDLAAQDFARIGLTDNISLGFVDDRTSALFRIANRAGGSDNSTGLLDLPDRVEIVRGIIIDYLTIAGFSAQSAEFENFLAVNTDLGIGGTREALQNVSPSLIADAKVVALRRQPQLWAWHGYTEYIGPELLTGLARDLVKMGLARPY